MTFLITAMLIGLLFLSWKYILRLEPAGVFAVMWVFFAAAVLLLQNQIELRFEGCIYILVCVTAFVMGTIFCDECYNPVPSGMKVALRKQWVFPVLLVLLAGAMVNPLYSIILHGFSLRALLSMQDLLNMNREISEDRYYTGGAYSAVNQFFLIFCYVAPIVGGFCWRLVGKVNKTLCLLTLIPGTFIALTQSMKLSMISAAMLWFGSYIVCSYCYGLPLRIKFKSILRFVIIILLFFLVLFISMVFRTGEVSERTILEISQKFVTYAFGHMHCFDIWYTTYVPGEFAWGSKTFMGISNLLGVEERVQGNYTEFLNIGKNGFYGISNVYTIFRPLVEDVGEAGAVLVMFLMGFVANKSMKDLVAHRVVFLSQSLLIAIYAYVMLSFGASFYGYTSYLAALFLTYFILRFIQTAE
ncbi:MAG: oligosaccharide repeat unit polymerase [Prevotella sp.]|nr:oligosaccharide repeat unit polymerase [Prevotella sp.]